MEVVDSIIKGASLLGKGSLRKAKFGSQISVAQAFQYGLKLCDLARVDRDALSVKRLSSALLIFQSLPGGRFFLFG